MQTGFEQRAASRWRRVPFATAISFVAVALAIAATRSDVGRSHQLETAEVLPFGSIPVLLGVVVDWRWRMGRGASMRLLSTAAWASVISFWLLFTYNVWSGPVSTRGRPRRRRGRAVVSPPVFGDRSLIGSDAPIPRDVRRWAEIGAAEQASVTVFIELADRLRRVGAPDGLIEWCQRAAADEARHTDIAFALANRDGDGAVRPGVLAKPRRPSRLRPCSIERSLLAVESLFDGCINEATSAAEIDQLAIRSEDPQVQGAMTAVATDERDHAELAWAIVQWVISQHGPAFATMLDRRLQRVSRRWTGHHADLATELSRRLRLAAA